MNSIQLSGFLGSDPETKYFESGSSVTEFSLGVHDFINGEKVTHWFQCKCWGENGQKFAEKFRKSSGAEVTGKVIQEHWGEGENKRSKHTVTVFNWSFPPNKKPEGESQGEDKAEVKRTFASKAEYDAWKAQQDAQQPAAAGNVKAPF